MEAEGPGPDRSEEIRERVKKEEAYATGAGLLLAIVITYAIGYILFNWF